MGDTLTILGVGIIFGGVLFGMFGSSQQGIMLMVGGLFFLALVATIGSDENSNRTNNRNTEQDYEKKHHK